MIARTWQGAAPTERADAYLNHRVCRGIMECRQPPEIRCAYVRRVRGGAAGSWLLITRWESIDVFRTFGGEAIRSARCCRAMNCIQADHLMAYDF